MGFEQILCEQSAGIATITLNRPERLNAFTGVMGRELHEAFRQCDVKSFLQKRAPEWKMKPSSDMPDFLPGVR